MAITLDQFVATTTADVAARMALGATIVVRQGSLPLFVISQALPEPGSAPDTSVRGFPLYSQMHPPRDRPIVADAVTDDDGGPDPDGSAEPHPRGG